MSAEAIVNQLLSSSNWDNIKDKINELEIAYVNKLIENIVTYVDSEISIENLELVSTYSMAEEISQEITGIPASYSAIDGDASAMVQFAEQYSHLGVTEFDELAKEVLLDFLNLHNGLYIVQLSNLNICELSLSVPKQNGEIKLTSPINGNIIVIPINFKFGTVKFLLCRL